MTTPKIMSFTGREIVISVVRGALAGDVSVKVALAGTNILSLDAHSLVESAEAPGILTISLHSNKVREALRRAVETATRSECDAILEFGKNHANTSLIVLGRKNRQEWIEFFDFERDLQDGSILDPSAISRPSAETRPRVIAFYLPQYHPFKQNDEWWGPGFTEWTGVATAKPQYSGHTIPHVPADLGFYDLRLAQVRKQQGELAQQYGVDGFCYYLYWFGGRRLMEDVLSRILSERQPALPFCLCWANETWSRRWDGSEKEVLMGQTHDTNSDLEILNDLFPYFKDDRYIRVDGQPLFIIYRPELMPEPALFVQRLKSAAKAKGLPGLFVATMTTFGLLEPSKHGFDAIIEFPPHIGDGGPNLASALRPVEGFSGTVYSYPRVVGSALRAPNPGPWSFPGVMPRWDNTARKGSSSTIFHGSTPELFATWLRHSIRRARALPPSRQFVFVNSWNEWGEGAHLEPDRATGRAYLEAVQHAVSDTLPRGFVGPDYIAAHQSEDIINHLNTLIWENRVLASHRGRLDHFETRMSMKAGEPPGCDMASVVPGRMNIDNINGASASAPMLLRRSNLVVISGWSLPDSSVPATYDRIAYVIFRNVDGGNAFHTILASWMPRPDVANHFSIADASPNYYGFVLNIASFDVAPGRYSVEIREVGNGLQSLAAQSISLTVEG